jgi:hypothetical protein
MSALTACENKHALFCQGAFILFFFVEEAPIMIRAIPNSAATVAPIIHRKRGLWTEAVMVIEQVSVLPAASLTVNVTVYVPGSS